MLILYLFACPLRTEAQNYLFSNMKTTLSLLFLVVAAFSAPAQRGGTAIESPTETRPDDAQQLTLYLEAGKKYFTEKKYVESADAHLAALAIAERTKDKRTGAIMTKTGLSYEFAGKFKQSAAIHARAIAWKTANNADKRDLAQSYTDYGHIVGARLDSFDIGATYLLKAADIFATYSDTVAIYYYAYCYAEAGIIYTVAQQADKGIGLCLKALQLQRSIGDYSGMAMTYRHLTVTYIERKEFEKAHTYLDKAMTLATDDMARSGIYLNKGIAFEAEKKYPEAIAAFEQAFALTQATSLKSLSAEAALFLSKLYKETHDREKAKLYKARYETISAELKRDNQ